MALLPWKRALGSRRVWFSLLVILAFSVIAALAPWLAPHDPYRWSFTQNNLPPAWMEDGGGKGMAEYPLGTDRVGRDILSRLIYGTRTAFLLALTAVPLAALIGIVMGLLAGFYSGRLDGILTLSGDIIQSIPGIMLVVLLVLVLRSLLAPTWANGLLTLVIGFGAYSWPSLARLVRVNVLLLKKRPFIEAAEALGASPVFIVVRHLLPNVLHVILVWIINNIPAVILLEAVLGYIGVGVTGATDGGEFTVVSWGGLFFAGRSSINRNPFILGLPSLLLMLLCMSFILLADFLNEMTGRE